MIEQVTIINYSDLTFTDIGKVLDLAEDIIAEYGTCFRNETFYLEDDLGIEIGFRLTVTEDDIWTFENILN